jgi:hypothetical protein
MMLKCCTRALTVALAGWSITSFAGNPALSGLYRVGTLGLIDFSLSNGEIVGRYKGKGVCDFEIDSRVVSGNFEGNVFVGQVTLCQEGSACESPRAFPMLGFFSDKKMVTLVKLEPGCSSKVTDHQQLVFREAEGDERTGAGGSASQIATRNRSKIEQAAEAVRLGQVEMEGDHYRAASHHFQVAVNNDDTSAEAWLGLGASQIRLAQPQSAVGSLFKAQDRAHSNPALVTQIQYDLACAYALIGKKREALKALREAVRLGGPDISTSLESDPDLQALHGEKEFATLRPRGKR